MKEQDKSSALVKKINNILKAKKLFCVEISIKSVKGNKNIEAFLAYIDDQGILQSPNLSMLEEITDVLELFFESELGNSNFNIVVSSPGSDRKLKTKEDFRLFAKRKCKITYIADDLKTCVVFGIINSCSDVFVVVDCYEINSKKCDKTVLSIEFSKIKKASLA